VHGEGLVTRHRESYQLTSIDDRMADATVAALLYYTAENPLAISLEPGTAQQRDDGAHVLPIEVQIPLRNVVLLPIGNGAHGAQLSLYVTIKNRRGQPQPVQKLPFSANIPADKLEEALSHSARYTLPVVVRDGDQQVAVGVRDEFGSAESWVRLELTRLGLGAG
jgi:hypothetical protein